MSAGRVDVHHHAILPAIARLMREHGATFTLPWSLPQTWQVLADNRIDVALVSNPIPAGLFSDVQVAARFNRAANEAVAEFVAAHPGRFGLLAALPMPYVDAALDEVAYAFDTLRADGVVLIAHAGDAYLGAPLYDPVLAELNRRRAVVLVHPMTLPGGPVDGVPPVLADFLLDTTRAAISLIWTEALDRYPDISFILAHGGGFLPYAASRVAALGEAFYDVPAARVRSALGRFHYDLALTAPSGLPSLLAAVGPDRILYGTDWSAAPEPVVAAGGRAIDRQLAALDPAARAAIERDNALRLFPRLGTTG
ncbi:MULTISPECIES: amidohydrolase family protein [unclassified Solwaraspora]|uniref:amidohydrolase family protein n=1 Tax=unclassified Solwaraspora TaxID=2627926 RepID=UPI00259BBA57|nr:amidohydrolase family protein [Solwaraspora sp. WMMA2056]WJK38221.1 amidohydrolase family protein [Solwaraspora sp. WMMA2056]